MVDAVVVFMTPVCRSQPALGKRTGQPAYFPILPRKAMTSAEITNTT